MGGALEFTLNGQPVRLEAYSPNTTLLDFLRARSLTGSKEGCAEGDCGACSVAVIGRDSRGRGLEAGVSQRAYERQREATHDECAFGAPCQKS